MIGILISVRRQEAEIEWMGRFVVFEEKRGYWVVVVVDD